MLQLIFQQTVNFPLNSHFLISLLQYFFIRIVFFLLGYFAIIANLNGKWVVLCRCKNGLKKCVPANVDTFIYGKLPPTKYGIDAIDQTCRNADNPSDSVSKLYNPSGDVSYSTRHVEESWHHLMKSEDTAKFKQIAVCNFDFLLAAVSISR